jgi:uroporphyrinogen decarboxylase
MDSRERVSRAIHFGGPDRVPVMHAVLPAGWFRHGSALHAILRRYPADLSSRAAGAVSLVGGGATFGYQGSRDLAALYPVVDDFAYLDARSFELGIPGAAGLTSDEWGCVWEKLDPGVVGQVVGHPLDDWSSFDSYRWPDPLAHWRFDRPTLDARIRAARAAGKYIVAYAGNLFEQMQWLRGYDSLLIDLGEASEHAAMLAERVADYVLATAEVWLGLDCDAIAFNDDWGTQLQLMIRPSLWRDVFKPHYRRLFDRVHAAGRDVHFHSDGNTIEILPDLLELGVDVLNLQLSAMDVEATARAIGGRICLRTDVDRQYILTRASPTEVTDYVRRVLDLFGGTRGGIIACGEINSDSKLENVAAMYEAFERFGRYR